MKTEKTLSTKWFQAYRIVVLMFLGSLFLLQIIFQLRDASLWISIPFSFLYIFFILKYWWPSYLKFVKNFKRISYDEENLYIDQGDSELIVSFERVKKVELVSLDGIYKFETFNDDLYYCKPSIWYPFNFKKVDEELVQIRRLIKTYKQKVWQERDTANNLPSNN